MDAPAGGTVRKDTRNSGFAGGFAMVPLNETRRPFHGIHSVDDPP
jgi:hypothetical protein